MTLKMSKDTYTKFGEARNSRGRAINLNKNFNASVDADVDTDARASSIPLTSTSLRIGKKYSRYQHEMNIIVLHF